MKTQIAVYDPTPFDSQSKFRGVGRYLQILKENFPNWTFTNTLHVPRYTLHVFINPFFNFLQKPLIMKKIAKKQIAIIHDLIPLKYPHHFPAGIRGNFNIFLNKLALKNYDVIVTDSFASKKDIVQILKWPEDKVKVIYPCLPRIFKSEIRNPKSQTNSNNLKIKNFKLRIISNFDISASNFCLYVGDATWNKNLVNLAKGIKIINVNCVFVGKVFNLRSTFQVSRYTNNHPWQKELKEFLKEVEGDKRFIFAGYVDDYRLIKLYQQAKCNILISRDEGFGFSYLEAASQGCPSVLSNIPVLKEIASDSALFVSPEKPNEIADAIGELYFNSQKRDQIGFKAQQRSLYFNNKNFQSNFLSLIYQ